MIRVDANLLIYAVNQDRPQHQLARRWWEQTLSSGNAVGLPWIALLAFIRICTHGRVFEKPLSPEAAIAYGDEWLQQPGVTPVAPGKGHWAIFRDLLTRYSWQPDQRRSYRYLGIGTGFDCLLQRQRF